MSKIRALNEYESGSESDDDANRKLSKEAQEEFAKLKYNQALKTFSQGDKQEAAKLFEHLLKDPYLNEDDTKQLTPSQCQLILGCLKILADLYRDASCQNLHRAKSLYARAISFDQYENVNLWFRLGTVSLQTGDLYTAYTAFESALRLRPSHWKCIENLVTVSYALSSFQSCLQFCSIGLAKDPCFIKGHVFRDMVYEIFPELKDAKLEAVNKQALNVTAEYDKVSWKEKYCAELREIRQLEQEKVTAIQLKVEEAKITNKIHMNLKSWSLVNVVKEVLIAYQANLNSHDFHNTVEITYGVQDCLELDEASVPPPFPEESQTEEESLSAVRQSRSSSDDKENANTQPGSASEDADKSGETSQPVEGQNPNESDPGNKKKNKRDVKWWQIEGKRRSQRVRGNLMPASPDKAKKENCFADQLKNLIPTALLGDDGSNIEKESAAAADKSSWQTKSHIANYFGTKEEENDVKSLLAKLDTDLATMLISTTVFLGNKVKCPWPGELRDLFLILYHYYRSHVPFPDLKTYQLNRIIKESFVCLAFVEIIVEKYKEELLFSDDTQLLIRTELDFMDDVLQSQELPPEYDFRVKWLTGRRLFHITQSESTNEQANLVLSQLLAAMEQKLEDTPMIIWSVNETSNLICLESVREKSTGFTKMQNSQMITDLYKAKQYEILIDVLKSGINFSGIEKRDLPDLYYYTVALFGTKKPECVCQCLNLVHHSLRFENTAILTDAITLLESIWKEMKQLFTWQNKRSTVGYLIKILVSYDLKPPTESVYSVSWCILHNILFTLEKDEPAFYLEEETVPNSILLLQLAHECLARTEQCCVENGKLMLYVIKAVLQVKKHEEYFAFEETRHAAEQAIYCLYSHPSKRSKIKYLKDHNSPGITLTWEICPILYEYYFPSELPEFDSYGSIGTEVECLFQRFLEIMPPDVEPAERQKTICSSVQNSENISLPKYSFPTNIEDIYYLIGDYHFKTKEWSKAVTFYTWDLAVNLGRFDSWAAIALSLGETINTTLNTADVIEFKELLQQAQSTAYCFRNALKIQPGNIKLRIEFGSFVYAMHAYCSRQMKQHAAEMDMELFHVIEKAKQDFLQSASKCFESVAKNGSAKEESATHVEEELWIHHYMLGKIYEKTLLPEDAKEYLNQYELAGRLLHDQGAPYPSKMNYYSPPELAIEALEIYYRIHATILTLIEKPGACDEKFYLEFIRRQENGPFVKNKQGKGDGGEGKKGRKASEDAISKKELADISALLTELVSKVDSADLQSSSTTSSSSSSSDDTSSDSIQSSNQSKSVSSYCLAEFQKRLHEKELREDKIAAEANKPISISSPSPVNIYDGLQLEENPFYTDFKQVEFGAVISLCLKAMEECILRYPSHSKSYFRIAHSYIVFLKDATKAKEYLMGSPALQQKKISGLFGERKSTNFFNGIWRNPIDDIDRPGSFSYHMNKTMQLLLDVLTSSNEHSILAEVVVQLSKVPDNEKKYLSNPDREQFCQQALSSCVTAVKRKQLEPGVNLHELGLEVLETFTKLQKHSTRTNPLGNVLFEIYKAYLKTTGVSDEAATIEHALRYFNLHAMALKQNRKVASGASGDGQKGQMDARKRGRRATRQVSQEFLPAPSTSVAGLPQMSMLSDLTQFQTMAAIYQSGLFQGQSLTNSMNAIERSISNVYPQLNVDAVQSGFNANLQKSYSMAVKTGLPPPAHAVRNAQFSSVSMPKKQPLSSGLSKQLKPGNIPMNFAKRPMPTLTHASGTGANPSVVRPHQKKQKVFVENKSPGPTKHIPPPPPSEHPIRINTSPYKAQSTVVEQPPSFSFSKQEQSPVSTKKPPIAHYHPNPKPAQVSQVAEENEMDVEVIDLTTRTPEKAKMQIQVPEKLPEKLPEKITAPVASTSRPQYPLPPKKKHHHIHFQNVEEPPPPPPPPVQQQLNLPDDVEVIFLD